MPLDNTYAPTGASIVEQFKLEQEMLDAGMSRFLRREEKTEQQGAISQASKWLVRRLIAPVAAALSKEVGENQGAGRKARSLPYIEQVGPDEAAYLALAAILGSLTKADHGTVGLTELCIRVGRSIENELWMRQIREQAPDDLTVVLREANEYRDTRLRDSVSRIMAKKMGHGDGEWPIRIRTLVGVKLVEAVRVHTGLIEFVMTRQGRQTTRQVALTADTREKIVEVRDAMAAMSPALMPCIVPPKPWTSARVGGYHSGLFRRLRLIKTWSEELVEELDNIGMSAVLSAVNAVQNTPWRINSRVLETLEEAIASEQAIGKLPARLEEIPQFPEDQQHDKDIVRKWKRAAAKVHSSNRKNLGKRLQAAQVASLARRFVGRPIWFPHQMDFRGRLYCLPVGLNPQGPDHAKALLLFDRAYPITDERALGWLMITGANRYGVDKCSLVDRIAWVEQNEAAILSIDEDPWGPGYDFWSAADEPFQFLAFCFDYAAFKRHGWGYESRLPVGLDGSCNGLQHYSAALRDPEGGRAVNLVSGEVPSDIYGIVAEKTLEKVKAFLRPEGPDEGTIPNLDRLRALWNDRGIDERLMAGAWLELDVDRKITKRSVMTLPYGATQYSARDFIEDAIWEKLEKGARNPFYQGDEAVELGDAMFRASLWLQPLVWHSIGETVKAAREGMDWLKECAKIVCADGLPVTWKTPDGFVVQQAYREWQTKRIETVLHGTVLKMTVAEIGLKVDGRAQTRGIAPNWVHSMDACALRMFVNVAVENGLHDFALVHDSYGAPAAKVDLMVGCLKEAFISLYHDHDPILNFYEDIMGQLKDDKTIDMLPPPPKRGSLELSDIRNSDYFFA